MWCLPAAKGVAADVPVCDSVQPVAPFRRFDLPRVQSVVTIFLAFPSNNNECLKCVKF